MLSLASPLWLVAGGLTLLAPLLLHLIAPRPPARAPLPTARFLEPQAWARRRLSRRPRDPVLLALRCLFLALLFTAMAGPRVVTPRAGTAAIILVDSGAADDAAALRTARALAGEDAIVVATDSGADFAATLRALPRIALERTRADSVRAWWITALRWQGWSAGTSTLRSGAWPGAIGIIESRPSAPTEAPPSDRAARAAVLASGPAAEALVHAFAAIGFQADTAAAPQGLDDAAVIVASEPAAVDPARLLEGARAGATAILQDTGAGSSRTLIIDGVALRDIVGSALDTDPDAGVVAAWADGTPAASARPEGMGCMVRTGVDLRAAATLASPELPALLRTLATACADPPDPAASLPLDSTARALLAGGEQPTPVAVDTLPGAGADGLPLARWLLAAALAVALLETLVAARRDRGTRHAFAGTSRA